MAKPMQELNQNEIANISGGCQCLCNCERGNQGSIVPLGDVASSYVCITACRARTLGDMYCDIRSCT
jgi:hypothetical protein